MASLLESATQKLKNEFRKNYEIDRAGGLTKIYRDSVHFKRRSPDEFLSVPEMIYIMTEEEWNSAQYANLTAPFKTCVTCGAPISYSDRTIRNCADCRLNKRIDKSMTKFGPGATQPAEVVPFNPPMQMLSEEEQKEFANSMCRVSTVQDIVQHAPDRAIVMIHIENFSPTINNYYGDKDEK